MEKLTEQKLAGLSRLTIEREKRPTSSPRNWLMLAGILFTIAAVAAAAAWWYYRETGANILAALSEPPVEVNLLLVPDVNPAAAAIVLVANGKIVSDRRVDVATKVSGQIVELGVEQGDIVKEGDVLARIEDVVYRAQRDEAAAHLAHRTLAVDQARSDHERALAAVEQARAECNFAQYNFHRLERLSKTNEASEFELTDAKNRFDAASAALHVALADQKSRATAIELAEADRQAAEAALRVVQKRLDDCAIRAPISGVILERNAQVGDFLAAEGGRGANANAQLVSIADMTLLRVEIDVSERDVQRLRPKQPARITPDAERTHFYDGEVMWIDPIGDYAKATVQVKTRIFHPGPDLRVDGSAKVEFLASDSITDPAKHGAKSWWLPKSALKLVPGSEDALVFTVENGKASPHPVKIGAKTEDDVEILRGVSAGMKIIAENAESIDAGRRITIRQTLTLADLP